MPTIHAKNFSASASERWLNCTASVKLYADAPKKEDTGSEFAREGSCAHEVADLCLQNNHLPTRYIDKTYFDTVVTVEMAAYVQEYLDYIHSFEERDSVLMPEQRVDYSNYVEEGFGTADAIIIQPNTKHVDIFDLKYGRGVKVDAVNNPQARLYALGILNEYSYIYDIETVTVHIVQPRLYHFSSWDRTVEQLKTFGEFAKLKSEEAWTDDRRFRPTEKGCMWCDFKPVCKALAEHTFRLISDDFTNLDTMKELTTMTKETMTEHQIKNLLDNAKLIKGFLDSIEGYVKGQLEVGQAFPGYKLVEGRSSRKLTAEANEYFKGCEEFWDTKLKTLTAIEKIVGKKEFAELKLTTKPEGKPTLAPESDKRDALDMSDGFDVIEESK